jgi:hypothetical protein
MKNILQLTGVFFLSAFLLTCQKEFSYSDVSDNLFTYDVDAKKFIDSCGITGSTQKFAINNFVKQLKDSSLWTKFVAVYPMVGGIEATIKWNLKDPRNSDDAYRLTFYGNPVYSSTGLLLQTTSDYADTHLSDAVLIYDDNSISYYSRTQNTVSGYDMGCYDQGSPFNEMAIYHSSDASNWFGYYDFGPTPANTKGLFMLSATASNVTWYENGTVKNSRGAAPVPGSTGFSILIGTVSRAPSVGMRECALATIGKGLTDAQSLTFYRIVQNFEATLGR